MLEFPTVRNKYSLGKYIRIFSEVGTLSIRQRGIWYHLDFTIMVSSNPLKIDRYEAYGRTLYAALELLAIKYNEDKQEA